MASCRQDATQSRSLRIRWAPIIGRPIAATSANIARTWNVTGVWDKGAENHSKRARISRATTATQRPRPAMKRRTNEVRTKGWINPYADNRTMIRENIANAIGISLPYICSTLYLRPNLLLGTKIVDKPCLYTHYVDKHSGNYSK